MSENSAVDPRLPKKARRRDESPPDKPPHPAIYTASTTISMECDDCVAPKQAISYKDKVMLALKSMDFTLVVKALGCRVGYNVLHNRILAIWKPAHPIKLVDIENDHFLVKFASWKDYIHALIDGPWTIFGHYLIMKPWSIDFNPSQALPSRIMAWVRLSGLSITWYKRGLIEAIRARIGSVIKIDYQTDNGRRGCFAQMAINLNLHKPLVSKIAINASDFCPQKVVHDDKGQELNQGQHNAPAPVVPSEPYGPWMLVERRRRRPNTKAEPSPKQSNLVSTTNSRYNPIFIENNDDLHLDAQMDASPQLETQFELRQSNGLDDSGKENINPSNGVKAKGKQTLLICTPHALALASKNGASVTYSRKVGSNVATSFEAPPTAIASKKSIMRPSNPAILSTTSNRPNEHGKVVSAIQVRNGSDDLNLAHVGALEDSLMATLE
ncbi:hypothetical protein V6N11_059031 [Hibiscus sabdariffa]|uniref:DUF4283 domain-containing protein n=1 Tax=Hibiscus sabdariffa TaxID=183260 RepID=A0ABR2U6S6_9ROSI